MTADNAGSRPTPPARGRFRGLIGGAAAMLYVAVTVFCFVLHLLGDPGGGLAGYFFRWDMFPDYATTSVRRTVIGERADGTFVRLVPGPGPRFRQGSTPAPELIPRRTRLDMPGSVTAGHGRTWIRTAADRQIARYREVLPAEESAAELRLKRVYLIETYWPARMNLSDAAYGSSYGQPHPHRRYWRVLDEARVDADGIAQWKPDTP